MYVHGRTKIHHDWSAFETAAVKIGEDIFEADGKNYWVNGVMNAKLPAALGGYQVDLLASGTGTHTKRYLIRLGNGEKIDIKTFDAFVWIGVEGSSASDFGHSTGMLGAFDNGRRTARNGETFIKDTNAFGQEWQVRHDVDPQLFHTLEGPQWPFQRCKMPKKDKSKAMTKRNAHRVKMAKAACAKVPKESFDDCVSDVVATGNSRLAGAYLGSVTATKVVFGSLRGSEESR
jgi:hypothetical protein